MRLISKDRIVGKKLKLILLLLTLYCVGITRSFAKPKTITPKLLPIVVADSYNEGSSIDLFCSLSFREQTDQVQFTWLKDGIQIGTREYNRVKLGSSGQGHSILSLSRIADQDAGNYTCVAENSHGSDSTSAQVVVSVELSWIVEPQDVKIGIGKRLLLKCSARGKPQPVVRWNRLKSNNKTYDPISTNANITSLGGELEIKSTALDHSGLYECHASNGLVEQDLRKIVKLDILVIESSKV